VLTVAFVLRSGGDYRPEHVARLADGVKRHLGIKHQLVCLSDMDVGSAVDRVIPLRHGWPGWWSKLELFSPGTFGGPVLYLDLDTIAVGRLGDIAVGHRFTVLRNFWAAERIGSGVMAWDWDLSAIYAAFLEAPERFMREYRTTERWGDQGFIRFNAPIMPELWQERHPGKVVSFKLHCRPLQRVPAGARIVAFHGQPRPWEMTPRQRQWFEARAAA
jgi:hypothetical protein